MNLRNFMFPAVLVATLGAASVSAHAATVMSIGDLKVDSATKIVTAPVYVELDKNGMDSAQAFAFRVHYSPAASVKSIRIIRGGITANFVPSFEMTPRYGNTISYLAIFPEAKGVLPFSNTAMVKDQVALIEVTLNADVDPSTPVELRLDPKMSSVSNEKATNPQNVETGTLQVAAVDAVGSQFSQ